MVFYLFRCSMNYSSKLFTMSEGIQAEGLSVCAYKVSVAALAG